MKTANVKGFIRKIWLTRVEEISCSECLERLPAYVDASMDAEQAGMATGENMPELHQHLLQCGICQEEYKLLYELVSLESTGDRPARR